MKIYCICSTVLCSIFVAIPVQAQYVLVDDTEVTALDVFQECDVCPEMIVLPLGDFIMGGPIGDSINGLVMLDGKLTMVEVGHPAIGADERPLHSVVIDIPIAMGGNEITHDQWMACVDDGGCGGHLPRDTVLSINEVRERVETTVRGSHPVIDVSNLDAQAYVTWLNEKVGVDAYRLPTEAEWEYANRAGTQTRFAQGDQLSSDQANFSGEGTETMTAVKRPDLLSRRAPVHVDDLNAANSWGLRHMSGNVIERTRSCYTEEYRGWSTSSEWLRQSLVSSCKRVSRGGGYNTGMDYLRVASRGSALEDSSFTWADGSSGVVADAFFETDTLNTVAIVPDDFTFHADVFKLPRFEGMGTLASSWVALSLDDALQQQAIDLVAQASTGDIVGFRTAFEDFVMAWGRADDVAAGSRGPNIDARHMTFLENVFDEAFSQGNLGTQAGAQLTEGVINLLDVMAVQFLEQVVVSNALFCSSDVATFDALLTDNPLAGIVEADISTAFIEIVANYEAGIFTSDSAPLEQCRLNHGFQLQQKPSEIFLL